MRIVSVNVAMPGVLLEWATGDVISAIGKRPVDVDELELSVLNLAGDQQADTRRTPGGGQVHGGVHQAVYAFPAYHYPRLEAVLGRPLGWGFMGENLDLAALPALSPNVQRLLMIHDRDLSGGVPEAD